MINSVIFDFDGTLFDSMFIWENIATDYLRSIGYEPRENLNELFKSMSLNEGALYYKNNYNVSLSVKEIMDGVNHMIEHYYLDVIQPKNNVKSFLQNLKSHNIKMCIASATEQSLIESALLRCGMSDYFSEILTCSAVGHGKDKPDIFRLALQHLNTDKQNTLVFEDAFHAAKTAKQDGFKVVGVFDDYEENSSELKKLVDIYLSDYSDFKTFWKYASVL